MVTPKEIDVMCGAVGCVIEEVIGGRLNAIERRIGLLEKREAIEARIAVLEERDQSKAVTP